MLEIKVSPETMQRLSRLDGQLDALLEKGVMDAGLMVQRDAQKRVPVAFGTLRRSIATRVKHIGGDIVATVGTNLVYGPAVEYGRPAGKKMPPPRALQRWVVKKGMNKSMAFVVARAIGRRGTKPRPYLEPALAASQGAIVRHFETQLRRWADGQ